MGSQRQQIADGSVQQSAHGFRIQAHPQSRNGQQCQKQSLARIEILKLCHMLVGNGTELAISVRVASCVPKADAIAPGASDANSKLAAEMVTTGTWLICFVAARVCSLAEWASTVR